MTGSLLSIVGELELLKVNLFMATLRFEMSVIYCICSTSLPHSNSLLCTLREIEFVHVVHAVQLSKYSYISLSQIYY